MTTDEPTFHLSTLTFYLNIHNPGTSGGTDDEVYICLTGLDPDTGSTAYLDFSTGSLTVTDSIFANGTAMQSISALKTLAASFPSTGFRPVQVVAEPEGGEFLKIYVPAMKSSRIYFSKGSAFPSSTANSGPTASKGDNIMFDKVEFDTATPGQYNINSTSVDFYGISYTLAVPATSGEVVEVGYDQNRSDIIAALRAVPGTTPADSEFGNMDIFSQLFVEDANNTYRVLAPKTMAVSDWDSGSTHTNARRASHFMDSYVSKACYAPNREFEFYSKLYPSSETVYYGKVDAAGENILLYTDSARTQAYAPVPSLPKPTNAWADPDFDPVVSGSNQHPSYFHNVNGANDTIDWGYLLMGNSAGTGAGANWGTDPLAIAIMVSMCRGVMHLNDGTSSWIDSSKYYQGGRYTVGADGKTVDNGAGAAVSSPEFPIYFFSQVLHQFGYDGKAYVLSYDDVYGDNPSVYFNGGAELSLTFNSLHDVKPPASGS